MASAPPAGRSGVARRSASGGTGPGEKGAALTIGQAALRSGVPAKTIRYYESIGLIPAPVRGDNRYRVYCERDLRILHFVRQARSLGFSIHDAGALLALWLDRDRTSAAVKRLALDQIARIDDKLAELTAIRDELARLAACCHGDERPECPILDRLSSGGEASDREL